MIMGLSEIGLGCVLLVEILDRLRSGLVGIARSGRLGKKEKWGDTVDMSVSIR